MGNSHQFWNSGNLEEQEPTELSQNVIDIMELYDMLSIEDKTVVKTLMRSAKIF